MSFLALVLELLLAVALLVASSEKFLAAGTWRAARADFGVAEAPWRALPFVETVVGAALGIGFRPWAAASAALLFVLFGLVLSIAHRRGVRADCNCFGAFLPTRIGPVAIGRAAVLALIALALVVIADPAEPLHPLALTVPLTAAALVSLYSSIRPPFSN